MSGVNICWVVREGVGSEVGGYQPGVYVPLKALFLVVDHFEPDVSVAVGNSRLHDAVQCLAEKEESVNHVDSGLFVIVYGTQVLPNDQLSVMMSERSDHTLVHGLFTPLLLVVFGGRKISVTALRP